MEPEAGDAFADIAVELEPGRMERFRERIEARDADSLAPASADEAREQLLTLASERIEQLEELLARHIERDEAARPLDEAGFEDTEIGERLRRYLLANNRTLLRILDTVQKRRREGGTDRGPVGRSGKSPDLLSGRPATVSTPSPAERGVVVVDFPVYSPNESCVPEPARIPPAAGLAGSRVEPASSAVATAPAAPAHSEKATNEPNGRSSWSAAARLFLGLMVVLALGLLIRQAPAVAGESRVQSLSWQAVGAVVDERTQRPGES